MLPTITENTATLLSEAQRQDDDDRDPFASDCCIIYFHHVHLAAQVTGTVYKRRPRLVAALEL